MMFQTFNIDFDVSFYVWHDYMMMIYIGAFFIFMFQYVFLMLLLLYMFKILKKCMYFLFFNVC